MGETGAYGLSPEALLSLGSMEGVYDAPVVVETQPPAKRAAAPSVWRGYLVASMVAAAAYGIHYLPFAPFRVTGEFGERRPVSASILAILVGAVLANLIKLPAPITKSCSGIVRKLLPSTIILTGVGLNLASMASIGLRAFSITLVCIALATASAYYVGNLLGLRRKTGLLIGAGTAICGTSAIIAVAPLIGAEDEDVLLSVGTINLLGLVLMFALPVAGGLLHLPDAAYGIWAGVSIHAVPQVVAAGFAYSSAAGAVATLVKLVRVAMLGPFMFVLAVWYARQRTQGKLTVHYAKLVPPFVWGFLGVALLNTLGLIPALQFQLPAAVWGSGRGWSVSLTNVLTEGGNILLTIAMAAMGLEVNARFLLKVGGRALWTGVAACVILCGISLALILI